MDINNFKLKCEISQNIHIDLKNVRHRIISELQKDEYQIIEQNDEIVSFDNSGPPLFEMRGASSSKLEEGIFELIKSEQNMLKLTYFVSYKFVLFSFLTALIIAYFLGAFLLVLAGFLLVTFVIQFFMQKSNAINLIKKVIE